MTGPRAELSALMLPENLSRQQQGLSSCHRTCNYCPLLIFQSPTSKAPPSVLAFVSVDAEDDLGGFLEVFHVVYME